MKLIDLLTTGRQIRTIPKPEIPSLLGELEVLKARLWVTLTEFEGLEPVVVFAKANRAKISEDPAQTVAIHPPDAIRNILDCLGLPSRPPPISSAALDADVDELQFS